MSTAVFGSGAVVQAIETVAVPTSGRGISDITDKVQTWLASIGADAGLLTVFIRHTSASILIQENAAPEVRADLLDALDRLAPQGAPYRHAVEGPDDMPAHIKAMLTPSSIAIPVLGGRLALGTWQGLYLVEHRTQPHRREIVLHYLGMLENGGT